MTWILLLRGINVGRAKRMPMAELRRMLEDLGFRDVSTLLNSGNAVFTASRAATADALTKRIERAVEKTFGFTARCFVLSARDLSTVMAENRLVDRADNPSRLVVAFLPDAALGARLRPLLDQAWGEEALAVGTRAAYLWCPHSIAVSPLIEAVGRALGTEVTMRNWATVEKIARVAAP
jgi:uncharacterized protein (DUF1697 family)